MNVKKRSIKLLATLLAMVMVITSVPMPDMSVEAATVNDYGTQIVYGSGGKITRAEWLHDLAVVFEMSIEDDAAPDNYFADLENSHKYYDDILLAVQFGVVNIDAGGEVNPDGYVTRDFAVTTLNFCLGYQAEENENYAFSDYSACTSAVDAAVAVDKGWLTLIGGQFQPNREVTSDEVKAMLNGALAILEEEEIDVNYDSQYTFETDVIVVPKGVQVAMDNETTVRITDCPVVIQQGSYFAVYFNGIPVIYKALSVEFLEHDLIIQAEQTSEGELFEEVDAQGQVASSDMEFIPAEGVELEVEDEETATARGARVGGSKSVKNVKAKTELTIAPGVTASIDAKVKNPRIKYEITGNKVYVALEAETSVSYSIKGDIAKGTGIDSVTLFTCPVMGIGSFDVTIELEFSGKLSGKVDGYFTTGIECQSGDRIRTVKSFKQKQFYFNVEATGSAGLKVALGITQLPVVEAYIYAEAGAKAQLEISSYTDGKEPNRCTHFAAYLYFEIGAKASVKLGIWKNSLECVAEIFTDDNSPVKVVHHYEDGKLVPKCTRGKTYANFFTKGSSKYGGSGWYGANGQYGLNADGTPFVLYNYTTSTNDAGETVATITKYNGNSYGVIIPSELDGYKVTTIGESAFKGKSLTYVEIPDSVTYIGNRAFAGCSVLKEVKLSKSLVKMGYQAFANTAIEAVEIPKSLEYCETQYSWYNYDGPFDDCDKLKTVTFEKGTTMIALRLFAGCTGIETIYNTCTSSEEHCREVNSY